jgi:Na+-driven multidrug efflux pump
VSAVLVIIVLMRRTDACKLIISKLRFYKPQLMKITRLGLPAGIQNSLFAISNVLIQSFINSFGDVFMAGCAAAGNIEGFIYVSMLAFYQTAVNYVGQNVGANQYDRVKKIVWTCMGCVTCVGLLLGVSAWLFGRQLLPIYITDSPQAIEYGMIRLTYLALPYFVCGIMDVSTGALRGMGYSFVPMLVSIFGVCGIRIGWLLTVFQIPQYHTPGCLFLSYLVSWLATLIGQITLFVIVYKKKTRELSADTK